MLSQTPFDFAFVAAPPALAGYLNSLHVFATAAARIEDVMPAYSPQLFLMRSGAATMRFADRREAHSSPAFVTTQLDRAAPFRLIGPAETVGASFTALGWAAITGLPADEWKNRVITLREGFAPEIAGRIEALATEFQAGAREAGPTAEALGAILADAVTPLDPELRDFVTGMQDWLSSSFAPDLSAFYAASPYSQRKIQRLAKRFFGNPPATLIKRFRAIRASTLLTLPVLPPEVEGEIFDAFYDQSHMIREIRRFTGRTPRRIAEGKLAAETLGIEGYGHNALSRAIAAADAGRP